MLTRPDSRFFRIVIAQCKTGANMLFRCDVLDRKEQVEGVAQNISGVQWSGAIRKSCSLMRADPSHGSAWLCLSRSIITFFKVVHAYKLLDSKCS